jgi:ribosomal protein L11 methyltransferase
VAWQRVDLVVEAGAAEALADALEQEGAIASEISDADAGTPAERAIFGEPGADAGLWPRTRVSALFRSDAPVARIVDKALESCSVTALAAASLSRVEDEDWVTLTQRQFAPIRAGERLWIVPTWHDPPEPGATGSHPTTRLCLAWLEKNVTAGDTVIDYGCGSGILGIAALKLGAAAATGVDIDPRALETARYNSQRNGVALDVMNAQGALPRAARITVANILANPLRMLAPILASLTQPGGLIALSGILDEQADEVCRAYAPWSRLAVSSRQDGWVLLAGRKER